MQAMLSIGAAMLGACHVLGIDVDADALEVAQANVAEYEDELPVRVDGVGDLQQSMLGGGTLYD